ncbi:protein kinase [Nonomuraea typhae]|uniref:non-specific serine/threonine protein kinase n=1 Tax=Nonomuraea typhae TaxID=2603600 RepID=A0ABW7Z6B8_9ACTN
MTHGVGELLNGRYLLREPVGAGGMGRVWRARDELLGREVAIKEIVFPVGLEAAERALYAQRALREARAAARLSHPGSVVVHDVAMCGDVPIIVMELVRGRSLATVIADGPLAPAEVARIGAVMAEALVEAHAAGVVHRDLKPANVLLAGKRVVITDFGIASLAGDPALTESGVALGTPAYMSPEQAAGVTPTPAGDLWSLGATLYAAVEGRPPFTGSSQVAVLAALVTRDPPEPLRAGALRPLLTSLLRRDPAERPDGRAVAQMLESLAHAEGHADGYAEKNAGHPGTGAAQAGRSGAEAPPRGGRREPPAHPAPGSRSQWDSPELELRPVAGPEPGPRSRWTAPEPELRPEAGSGRRWSAAEELTDTRTPGSPAAPAAGKSRLSRRFVLSAGAGLVAVGVSAALLRAALGQRAGGTGPASGPGGEGAPSARAKARPGDWVADGTLGKVDGPVNGVLVAPDGRIVISGGRQIVLWDVVTRRRLRTFGPVSGEIVSMALAPHGRLLAAGTAQGEVSLWESPSGKSRGVMAAGGPLRAVAFNHNAGVLAVAAGERVRLWDVAEGGELQAFDAGGPVRGVAFDATGLELAVGAGRTVRVRDVDGRKWRSPAHRCESDVGTVAFNRAGSSAMALCGGEAWVWNSWDGTPRRLRHGSRVAAMDLTLDGAQFVTGGGDAVRIWELGAERQLAVLTAGEPVTSVSFDSWGTMLAVGTGRGEVSLWRRAT